MSSCSIFVGVSIIYRYRLRNNLRDIAKYFKKKWKETGSDKDKEFFYWMSSIDKYVPDSMDGGLFAQTADSAIITNTTTETSIIGEGVGNLTVPAYEFRKGDSFELHMHGDISSLNNETLEIRMRNNGDVLATTGPITLVSTSGNGYDLRATFVVREVGEAGTAQLMTSGMFQYSKSANNTPEAIDFDNLESTNFNTHENNTLDITVEWGTADPGNAIDSHVLNLYKIF